jgi:hypothetical protein
MKTSKMFGKINHRVNCLVCKSINCSLLVIVFCGYFWTHVVDADPAGASVSELNEYTTGSDVDDYYVDNGTSTPIPSTLNCYDGWHIFNNTCFKVVLVMFITYITDCLFHLLLIIL